MKAERGAPASTKSLLLIGAWFGIFTGLVEGVGLLLFQRVNWAAWARMIHVSQEILWVSPLVDLVLFLLLALIAGLVAWLAPRFPAVRVIVFVLTFLAVYDWLALTERIHHRACLLLALGVAVAFSRWFARHENAALPFWKRTTPWLVAVWALGFVAAEGGGWLEERNAVAKLPSARPGTPNVLVIVVDTLRADHVSSYGYARPTTPNLDRLAAQGALFENAVSTCSWSLPSHVSLLTGRYQFEHGIDSVQPMSWWGGVNDLGGHPTLGEALAKQGYRSGAFSGNRLYFTKDLGLGRGFIHFEDYFHSPADSFVRTLYGREFSRIYLIRSDKSLVKRMLRALGWTSLLDQDAEGAGSLGGAFGVHKRADEVNREVLRWIDRDRQRPFFAFLNYFDVHSPYRTPPGYPKPSWKQDGDIDDYDNGVKYVDDYIGVLMQELEQRGLAENTLLVITSDHGEALGQHHMATHGFALYWELIRVPLVIWFPGHVPAGVRTDRPITNAVIPATVMDLLGGGEQDLFPGPVLSSLWNTPGTEAHWPEAISELARNKYPGKRDTAIDDLIPTAVTGPMKSLVTPQWHLITHETLGDQLYDWVRDPGESNNLVTTAAGQATTRDLKARIEGVVSGRLKPR